MAIKFLSGLNLSNVTAGSILKLDSNGNIVAATAGTDYSTSAGLWTSTNNGIYYSDDVRIGTYSTSVAPSAKLHVFDYQTTDPKLLIEDGNTGDASMEFKISTQSYTMGIDNSDSDKFVLAASTALGTTNVLEISTTGAPAFQGDLLVNGKYYLSNLWNISAEGASYAKFSNWVRVSNTGFYTTEDINMDLDDSSSRFVIRGLNNTEQFIADTGTSKVSIPNWPLEANDITQTTSGDNWSSTTSVEYNQTGIKLSRSGSGYVSAAPYKLIGSFTASVSFKTSDTTHLGIIFAASQSSQDNDNYAVILRNNGTDGTEVRVQKRVSSAQTYPISAVNVTSDCDDGNWHELTVSYNGKHIVVDIDGTNYFNQAWTDTSFTSPGLVGLAIYDGTCQFNEFQVTETPSTTTFEKLQLTSSEPQLVIKNPVSGTGNAVLKFEEGSGSTQNATITYNQGGQNNLTIATGYQSATDENLIHLAPAGNIGLTVRGGTGSNNGNVGIGTTLPTQELEVVGTIQATSTGTATLILRGDSGNVGDTGELDSTIKMLHDDGNHGILLETRNYAGAQSFEIKSLAASVETSRFLIDTDGTLKIPAYGAGFLTTDANGDVSVDTTSYVDVTGDTMTGDLTIQRGHGDLTFLTLKQENTSGDLVEQKSFIDFTFVDSNTNETPQVRIGAEVGNNDGSASSLSEEGMGAFVVYTNNADTDAGAAGTSLAERFRVDYQGKAFFTNNIDVNGAITGNILYTTGTVRVEGTSSALTLRSDVQHGQGDEDAVIGFNQGTTELAKIDQDGYLYASGFKVGTGSGVLRADGSTETITFGTMASASTGDYKDSDAVETYVGLELASYTLTSAFGSNAFTSYTDHSTQGYLTSYTETDTLDSVTGRGATTTNNISVGNLTAVGGTFTDPVTIYDSTTTENPRLSVGRNAGESIQFGVTDVVNTITAKQDSDSDGDHFFVLDRVFAGTGDSIFRIHNDGTPDLTIDGSGVVSFNQYNTAGILKVNTSGAISVDTNTYSTATGVADNADVTPSWVPANDPSYLTSVPSEYLTQNEGDARYVSFEKEDRSVPSSGGWYRLAKISRGGARFAISYTGGNMSPHTYVIDAFKNWNNEATIAVEKFGHANYITSFRISRRQGAGNNDYYLEGEFTSLSNTHSFEARFQESLGYTSISEIYAVSSGSVLAASDSTDSEIIEKLDTTVSEGLYLQNINLDGRLNIYTDANTSSTTALVLNGTEVEKRTLGSNAFNSTSYLPLAGGTITGQVIFPSAATTKPVLPNGYIARNDTADTEGTHDIWGISERYYPSNSTDADAWGIQWSGTPNEINFIGAGQKKLSIDLDTAGTVKIDGNAVATESYVGTAISNLVDSAPAALDTLNELAAALGDDASFSTTMSTALGNRLRIDVNNQSLSSTELTNARTNLGLGTAATSAATDFVAVSGDTMTGALKLNSAWSSTNLDANSFYVQNDTDGFAFGVGTAISSWFSWDSTVGQKRAIDVWNDGSLIKLGEGGHNVEVKNDLYVPAHIFHTGDTDTYMQFHAGDQWRVVTGGTERLEVNNTNTTVANTLTASGGINGLTLANGGISGANYNITGVNQLEINDPGEGIVFKSGSSGDMTLAIVDDSSDSILKFSGTGAKFEVAGAIKHTGLELTSGTSVDQISEFAMSFRLVADTWTDTGIDGTDLSTGTYAMQVFVSDHGVGGQHYDEYYSATISWFAGATNSTAVDEIPVHRAGHAPNAGDIQFRTQRASGSDSHDLMLQVKTNSGYTENLDNENGGKIMRFKFRRLM